jgi:hypothetical protein
MHGSLEGRVPAGPPVFPDSTTIMEILFIAEVLRIHSKYSVIMLLACRDGGETDNRGPGER